jgi:carbamoyl-phosphate synthase small subunit
MSAEARLMLEDGRLFAGRLCGARGTVTGEVCFNTGMTGYTEVLTDPSYHGQIVCLTTAEVGVYGATPDDAESERIQVGGFLVRRLSRHFSSCRGSTDLESWLKSQGVVAMERFDTRALTRHLRTRGAMRGSLSTDASLSDDDLLDLAREAPGVIGQDFTRAVSCRQAESFQDGEVASHWYDLAPSAIQPRERAPDIVVWDFGLKRNILRHLAARGCAVSMVPADTPAEAILERRPEALLLSNGPGDPAACTDIVRRLQQLVGRLPLGGICLGHQLLALACGARTEKLPFGHRGANHPVLAIDSGRVFVTTQNHGFAVRRGTLERSGLRLTHVSLNDGTVEGFAHRELPVVCVQYHPEASPGPHDAHQDFFDRFLDMVEGD